LLYGMAVMASPELVRDLAELDSRGRTARTPMNWPNNSSERYGRPRAEEAPTDAEAHWKERRSR